MDFGRLLYPDIWSMRQHTSEHVFVLLRHTERFMTPTIQFNNLIKCTADTGVLFWNIVEDDAVVICGIEFVVKRGFSVGRNAANGKR